MCQFGNHYSTYIVFFLFSNSSCFHLKVTHMFCINLFFCTRVTGLSCKWRSRWSKTKCRQEGMIYYGSSVKCILGFHQSVINTKNRNHSMNKVKNLGYDTWLIYKRPRQESNLCFFFHSRVICRSVSPKFIGLCMETPCLCPSEGHKYGGRKVTETSVTEFCYWNEKLLL